VRPEHDAAAETAGKASAASNGNPAIIKEARDLLAQKGMAWLEKENKGRQIGWD